MSAELPVLGLGLIGSGFMGKTHAFGFATAQRVFDLPYRVEPRMIADTSIKLAEAARHSFGFNQATANWRDLIADPGIGLVDITAPNAWHKEMALAAIAAGKHVYCEKPLAPLGTDALEMVEAAEAAGITTQVGFNYVKNPLFKLAREMIEAGEIGEVRNFRGIHAEDYMADADAPWTWRHDPVGGGAFADLGSHVIATARYLIGAIVSVVGETRTVIANRPVTPGASERRAVEVDDVGAAFVKFDNGASGTIEANWVAMGRKMQHGFEIYGSKGAIAMDLERLNQMELYVSSDPDGRQGFRTVYAGPEHDPYGAFCVAPGHQLGFNDLKAIEIRDFLNAIAGDTTQRFDFREGYEVQRVVEAVHQSAREGGRVFL